MGTKRKIDMKISPRDKMLLLLLAAVLVAASSWMLWYQPKTAELDTLLAENTQLNQELTILTTMEAQQELKQKEEEENRSKIAELTEKFPAGMTTEKIIYVLDQLEDQYHFTISSESFSGQELFFPAGGEQYTPQPDPEAVTEIEGESTAAAAPQTEPAVVEPIYGYRSGVSITFQTTYGEFKNAIDFLNGYGERISIQNVSIAYDASTGQLSGSLNLHFYSLLAQLDGILEPRSYEEPQVSGIWVGVENIFGTKEPAETTDPGDGEQKKNEKKQEASQEN